MLPTIVCILLGLSIIKTTVSQPGSGDGSPGSDSDATFCLFNAIDIVPYLPSGATLTTSCCQLASGIGTNLLAVSIYDRNPANYFPPTHLSKLCNTCDEGFGVVLHIVLSSDGLDEENINLALAELYFENCAGQVSEPRE